MARAREEGSRDEPSLNLPIQLVSNLAVKLLVERFRCRPVKPNHIKCNDRTPAPVLRARFSIRHARWPRFHLHFHLSPHSQEPQNRV